MSLINQDIKNLVSGISQQPPILRHPEQLEEQINGFSTEAGGLQKRPPTLYIKDLQTYTRSVKPNIHFINRDETEKYCLIFDGFGVNVYDLQGNPRTVRYITDKNYINTNNPRDNLKMVTIADYTFIVNTKITTAMEDTISTDYWATQGLLVNIKSGQYGRTYSITINGTEYASITTPDGSESSHAEYIATDRIANQLAYQVREKGLTCTTGASWLYITGITITDFVIKDGYNNQAAYGFHKTTQKFSNLPATAPNGFVVLVKGEAGSSTDDYYIRYDKSEQIWKETCKPGLQNKINKATMPHVLVSLADGTFEFRRAEWSDREIGDDDSNPLPSFIDSNINDIFFHRNRLGVLAGENVILTRSADFFNFWMQSATKVQDTDPIDLAASDSTISTLYNAVPFDTDLIVFSREAQFALMSEGLLTPDKAVLSSAVTHYEASLRAKPVNAGRNVYFVAERALYSTVREFFTASDNTESRDVQDITSHCPNYIPNGVYKIVPSTSENIMLYLTEGEETAMYVYKYLFIDGQRVQASWSKWDMLDQVYGASFIDNYLYIVISRNGYLCLERMSFTFNTTDYVFETYRVLLDSKRMYNVPKDAYNPTLDITVIDIPSVFDNIYDHTKTYSCVTTDGVYVTANNEGQIILEGDYTEDIVTLGLNYNMKIVLSTIMVKQTNEGNTRAMTEGRLQLRQMWFNYADSGYFKVTVDNKDKKKYIYEHTSRDIGTLTNVLGAMPFTTGKFKFPIQSKNENVTITLETDTPLPISLVGAGWIGNYQRRTRLV